MRLLQILKVDTMSLSLATLSTIFAFICSYWFHIYFDNIEQYFAILFVSFMDGIFGIIAGIKREGFKTNKAIKIPKTLFIWFMMLTIILVVEKGFNGTSWLSEVILTPFIVFQIVSILKNASMAGYVKIELLNTILDKIDSHKGIRV